MTAALPPAVRIREVGPRDGLQPEPPVPVGERIALVDALAATGLAAIEAAAFVSPRAVPAMAGAAEVLAGVQRRPDVRLVALVPNLVGAEMALQASVDEITVTVSISEEYNRRNVRMSMAESEAAIAAICGLVAPTPVDAVVSCAFGSPYEGDVDPGDVAALVQRLHDAGCASVTLADTTGMATPRRVADVVAATGTSVGLHLHDTRGTALVNAYAALQLGVTRFDTAVGGLGGSPFAHGAGGNLATEDMVALLDDLGVATGVDLEALLAVAGTVAALVGRPPSRLVTAGPRSRRVGG